MALTKLDKLPKLKDKGPRVRGPKAPSLLDRIPLTDIPDDPELLIASVQVSPLDPLEDTRPGRWWRTNDIQTEWGGTCGICGRGVRAIDLGWFRPAFATHDESVWACRDCRKNTRSAVTSTAPVVKRDRESKIAAPRKPKDVPNDMRAIGNRDWYEWWSEPEVGRWESEGGRLGP